MSRNHQRQKPAKSALKLKVGRAAQRAKAPTPSPDASGDEGYSELENLGDSDEDEDNVQAAEREYILKEVRGGLHFPGQDDSSRPLYEEDDDDGDDEDDGVEDEVDDEEDEEEAEEEDGPEADDDEADNDNDDESSWNGISSCNEAEAAANQEALEFAAIHGALSSPQSQPGRKVVRFANVPDMSSDDDIDTETDQEDVENLFPDIFVDVDTLPSSLRRHYVRDAAPDGFGLSLDEFGHGQEYQEYSTAESDPEAHLRSYDPDTPLNTPVAGATGVFLFPEVSMPVQATARPELDGYETDSDTTEDEMPTPAPVKKKTRRPEPDSEQDDVSDSDKSPVVKTPTKGPKCKPRIGHFSLDKSGKKPVAVLDPSTKRMLIFTVHEHQGLDLSPEHFHHNWDNAPLNLNEMVMAFGNAMFSQSPFDAFVHDPTITPDQAGSAVLGSALMTPDMTMSDDPFANMDLPLITDSGERLLNPDHFVKFGENSSDDEETDARPSTAGASDAEMGMSEEDLSHILFDAGKIAAAWPLSVDEADLLNVAALDSDSEDHDHDGNNDVFVDSTDITDVVGLVPTAHVSAPQSPSRRRRRDSMVMGPPPSSPIESVLQKRKSVADHDAAHKRHRSISDMAQLTV